MFARLVICSAYDADYPKAWTVTYEVDGVTEEFDAQDVQNYAIKRIDGESPRESNKMKLSQPKMLQNNRKWMRKCFKTETRVKID